jgi:copper homeostasis protein
MGGEGDAIAAHPSPPFIHPHPPFPPFCSMTLLEVCIETLPEAIQAVEAGADRLEVCSSMVESGTTPSIGLVSAIMERLDVPAFIMIRPRGGDFVFDDAELDVMRRDIDAMKRAGAHGIVSGALEPAGSINCEATKVLVDAADPLPFTFHRAFDLAPELEFALDELKSIGVRRVLTSGGASSAIVGADAIARLQRNAGNAMTMLAGGGVRAAHAAELVRISGVCEVHARPTRRRAMVSRTPRDIRFGSNVPVQERSELDPDAVRALSRALASID